MSENLHITHMYPELLNLYGDKGNIAAMMQRLRWRGMDATLHNLTLDATPNFAQTDILFLGGGSDREQSIVCKKLLTHQKALQEYVQQGGVLVAVCGGFQLLGHYYETDAGEKLEGLSLLDIYTKAGKSRFIGNVVGTTPLVPQPIVGFENHGGRTYIGDHQPLAKIQKGHGNNGEDGLEGVMYKNVFGTYLHGALFPKNPKLCDWVLARALHKKYPEFESLSPLDDSLENAANDYMSNRA